jgi:hypothetical protein
VVEEIEKQILKLMVESWSMPEHLLHLFQKVNDSPSSVLLSNCERFAFFDSRRPNQRVMRAFLYAWAFDAQRGLRLDAGWLQFGRVLAGESTEGCRCIVWQYFLGDERHGDFEVLAIGQQLVDLLYYFDLVLRLGWTLGHCSFFADCEQTQE